MTKFTNSIIKIILPLASLGFFLVASLIVLVISQGKKLEDDGSFVQTGIIRVNSIPTEDVKASINNNEVPFSEFRITNINPGIVNLKLTKEGYSPWEKQIKVESGIVKDVYAQLYPNTIPFTKVSDTNINKTFFSDDSQYIYYTVLNGTSVDGIWRLKLTRNLLDFSNTQQISQIIKFTDTEKNELLENEYSIESSNDNNKLILTVGVNHYLYTLSDTTNRVDLNNTLGFAIENVQWFKDSQSIIFTQDNKHAFEYDINSKEISLINYNAEGIPNYAISANNVFFIKDNKLMVYINKVVQEYQFSDKLAAIIPSALSKIYTPLENPNILILSTDDTLIYVDIQKDFLDLVDTLSTFHKSLSNGRLITYFKNDVLHSYHVEDNFNANTLDTSNYNLAINKDTFDNLEFAATGKNLVLFTNNKLTLMDYDGLNANSILTDFNFTESKLLFTNNSTEIYALIQEKNEIGTTVNNLYKFELKIK